MGETGYGVVMDRDQAGAEQNGDDAFVALAPRMPGRFVFASPLSDFVDEMKRRGIADRIIELERGASVTI